MIPVGTFVAWESPTTGTTYKGRVQERRDVDGQVVLRIKVAGTYETAGDATVPEQACRQLAKKKPQE